MSARPQPNRKHRGLHSYTVSTAVRDAKSNEVCEVLVDVLLQKRHTILRNAPHRERRVMYLGTRLAMQSMPGPWPWTEHVAETCCERSSFQNLWFPNGDEHRWIVVDLEY